MAEYAPPIDQSELDHSEYHREYVAPMIGQTALEGFETPLQLSLETGQE